MKARRRVFLVTFAQEEDGRFSAFVPQLPGCYSQGDDLEDAKRNVIEAIEGYLESMKKDRLRICEPAATFTSSVEVEG